MLVPHPVTTTTTKIIEENTLKQTFKIIYAN